MGKTAISIEANKDGILGVVLSIVSIFFIVPVVNVILALLGIIFSVNGIYEERRNVGIAGLVIGIFALVLGVLVNFVIYFVFIELS